MRLGRADLTAVLDFLDEVDTFDELEPYSVRVLERLRQLIPSVAATYQEVDVEARRFMKVLMDDAGGSDDGVDDEALYWSVGPCPLTEYRNRTGDLTTIRMSDVIGRVRWHEQAIYREYFKPYGIESFIDLGLGAGRDWHRSVILMRERDEPDFSERDRTVLESLRPHLRARESRASMRQAMIGAPVPMSRRDDGSNPQLTAREREILVLVAEGKTNADIASELWVSPATVKKHLENVYVKLGVGSRAAAANRIQVGASAG